MSLFYANKLFSIIFKNKNEIINSKLSHSNLELKSKQNHIYFILDYQEPFSKILKDFKYKRVLKNAKLLSAFIENLIDKILQKECLNKENVSLVPIPVSFDKYLLRGFSHINYLLKNTKYKNKLEKVLFKIPFSKSQASLNKTQRIKNAKNKFIILKKLDPEKTYIIFDDVCTTGATLLEAKKTLKKAGAKRVILCALFSQE